MFSQLVATKTYKLDINTIVRRRLDFSLFLGLSTTSSTSLDGTEYWQHGRFCGVGAIASALEKDVGGELCSSTLDEGGLVGPNSGDERVLCTRFDEDKGVSAEEVGIMLVF